MSETTSNSLLVIVSGPSGGGKTTLCEGILEANATSTVRAITCTTRPPRDGEKDGVDYFFLDADSFLKRVQAGHFLEHATVHGNSYGTLRSEVLAKLRQNKDVLLSVDVQGAAAITSRAEEEAELQRALVTVFITPPSLAILEERLRKRGKDSPEVIKRRLGVARHEVAQWRNFDYLIVSASKREDTERMQAIMLAEKLRQFRAHPPALD
jgi:guanylate kinase